MAIIKKSVLALVGFGILLAVFIVQDWYRFAKYSEIDAQRGIFGNSHLEVWIDINAAMPAPMRQWACKTLLDRETAILGGEGVVPYGCAADFDSNAKGPEMSKILMESEINAAAAIAEARGATKDQVATVKTCVATQLAEKVLPAQIEALNKPSPDPVAMTALSDLGQAATTSCFAIANLP